MGSGNLSIKKFLGVGTREGASSSLEPIPLEPSGQVNANFFRKMKIFWEVRIMAGRPSKPVQLIKMEGNKDRRTKAELEHREKMEKSLRTNTNFREDPATKSDPVAHKEFLRLRKLFKQIEFVEGLDQATINRYCQLKGQEQFLHDLYNELKEKMESYKQISKKLSIYDDMKDVITKQNQVRSNLLKLEDRLFLNPVARMRSIPKQPEDKKKDSPMKKFLESRNNAN